MGEEMERRELEEHNNRRSHSGQCTRRRWHTFTLVQALTPGIVVVLLQGQAGTVSIV